MITEGIYNVNHEKIKLKIDWDLQQ
jgi:hypothetical protein